MVAPCRAKEVHDHADSRYDVLQSRLSETEKISTPTVMVQGGMDACDEPSTSEGDAVIAHLSGGEAVE